MWVVEMEINGDTIPVYCESEDIAQAAAAHYRKSSPEIRVVVRKAFDGETW